jgi:hypothetical protein
MLASLTLLVYTALGPLGAGGCPLTGVFAGADPARVFYVTEQAQLASGSVAFAYRSRGRELVEVNLPLELEGRAGTVACAQTTYPQAAVEPLPVTAVRLSFFAAVPGLGVAVQGGGPLDLFARQQWVGVTLSGERLFERLAEGGPGRLFSTVLAGAVEWQALTDEGEAVPVRAAFALPAADDAALMQLVRAQLP